MNQNPEPIQPPSAQLQPAQSPSAQSPSAPSPSAPSPSATSRRIAGASLGLAAATAVASAANYGTNVWLARSLNIDEFGDAALIVSALLLLSAAATAIQLGTSHRLLHLGSPAVVGLRRRTALVGTIAAALVAGASGWLSRALNSTSELSFVILGVSIPIYLLMSIDRGVMQGEQRFLDFAWSMVVEAVSRTAITVGALFVVGGAPAAALGLGLSFALTRVHARLCHTGASAPPRLSPESPSGLSSESLVVGIPLVLLLIGQVMIANGDVIIVSAMAPTIAGAFAGVALIGRLSFPLAWAIINVAFPQLSNRDNRVRVARSTGVLVAGLAVVTAVGTWILGPFAASMLFGADAAAVQPWLVPYSIATGGFAVASLGAVIDVSAGRSRGSAWLVFCGLVQTVALALVARSGVAASVWAQVIVMSVAAVGSVWSHRQLYLGRRVSIPVPDPMLGSPIPAAPAPTAAAAPVVLVGNDESSGTML